MFSSKDLFFTPAAGGFTVSKSLRFRASATAYLNRTPASTGNRTTWTWSGWVKRGALANGVLFGSSGANYDELRFSSDSIRFFINGASTADLITTPVYRDPSAWYHILCAVDTTQATANNRVKIYINNVQVTSFQTGYSTYPPQNTNGTVNTTINHAIGYSIANSSLALDGYLAEVNFIDGYAYDPTYFGQYDANGIWQPKTYSGAGYGTNGFYLKFTDVGATSGSNTGYGKDFAGTNYWTTNNFGTTSTAVTYDSMLDSPTNATGDIGNYCTINPLVNAGSTISNANLTVTASTGYDVTGTLSPSGKCYFEMQLPSAAANSPRIGMGDVAKYNPWVNNFTSVDGAIGVIGSTGKVYVNGVNTATYSTFTTNNVVGFAFDPSNGKFWYSVDGVWANSGDPDAGTGNVGTGTVGLTYVPVFAVFSSTAINVNFGQRPFSYPPSSTNKNSTFSAINTQNLSTPTITNGAQYMAAVLYNGTSASNTVTASSTNSGNNPNGTTFQPDLVWIKSRSAATAHEWTDVVRGVTKSISSNSTNAQTTDTNGLTAFTSSGFTVGSDSNYNNGTGPATYVAWEWKAGNSSGSTNTSGTITSTVSANTTAGFSIVKYDGLTNTPGTVGHGLGAAPSMVITKNLTSGGLDWTVYHVSLGNTKYLSLNLTSAVATATNAWNNTSPTSTTFSVGQFASTRGLTGDTLVAYCFAPIDGFSSIGSYTGNGSADGVYVYTGMRPRWLLIKRTDTAGYYWWVWDTSRNTYNVTDAILNPNVVDAEASSSTYAYDLLSNGFKVRTTSASFNASGGTYIYAAFAENPFKISRAR